MKEADNILRIFREARTSMAENDSYKMKALSNQTLHSATIYQDPDNLLVAVLVYSLSKIIERQHYRNLDGWNAFHSSVTRNWDLAINYLEKQEIEKFRTIVGKIRYSIKQLSGDLHESIKDVFYKAGVNKAFKIYEHGLSSEQTAKLLGISLWDLSSYIGQSAVSEARISETMPVKKRVKIAEDIFG